APAVAKFSLFQSTTGIKFDPTSASNVTGVDPQLQPFGNNGGPTQTRRLFVNSPAVNTGSNPVPLANDQRGATFARVVGGQADIGAYEIQNLAAPDGLGTSPNVTVAGGTLQTITVNYVDDVGIDTASLGNDDLSISGPGGPVGVAFTGFTGGGKAV